MSTSFVPHSHIPYGKDGSGFYTDNTIGCFRVIDATTPLALKAIEDIPYQSGEGRPFTICDYGTADGGMSLFFMQKAIEHIRKHHGNTEVNILYEDQPVNDFKSLFLRIHGLIPGPPSYLRFHKDVYFSAVGTGFFDQCCPSGSVHLGFSSTAFHWLSERPCELSDCLHHTQSNVAAEKDAFARQAARDWDTLLLHRARELATGGRLVMATFCVDDEGQYLGNTKRIKQSMYACMLRLWRQLMDEGKITQEEFRCTTVNNYYRSVAEYSAPFLDETSSVHKAGLRLVSIETKVVHCPYNEKWVKEGKKDDPEAMRAQAKWFIPTTRTWSNSSFISGLSSSRSPEEKEQIVDEFFGRYEAEVAASPADHAMDYVHAYVVIEKV